MESFNINHVFIKNDLGVNYTTNFHHVMIHWHSDCETNPFLNYAEPAENFLFAKKKRKKARRLSIAGCQMLGLMGLI